MAIIAQSTEEGKWKHTLVRFLHYVWNDRKLFEGLICHKLKMNTVNPRAATDEQRNISSQKCKSLKTKQLHNWRKECDMA